MYLAVSMTTNSYYTCSPHILHISYTSSSHVLHGFLLFLDTDNSLDLVPGSGTIVIEDHIIKYVYFLLLNWPGYLTVQYSPGPVRYSGPRQRALIY